ncbi:hypothetical protein HN011_011840 [Eciton burchellii]|nr:hypothetical protein HN011_011840 [Eciton burchellii]
MRYKSRATRLWGRPETSRRRSRLTHRSFDEKPRRFTQRRESAYHHPPIPEIHARGKSRGMRSRFGITLRGAATDLSRLEPRLKTSVGRCVMRQIPDWDRDWFPRGNQRQRSIFDAPLDERADTQLRRSALRGSISGTSMPFIVIAVIFFDAAVVGVGVNVGVI